MRRPRPLARGTAALLPLAAAGALLLGAAAPAQAQLGPYYLRGTQSFTHDSNLFRAPEGAGVASDTVSSTGLAAGLEQPLGRQRLSAQASVALNRFRNFSELDNNGHRLDLRLDWETIARLSGDVRFGRSRQLASYADTRALGALRLRNIVTAQDLSARARFGGASLLSLEADVARREQSFSAPQYRSRELEQTSVGAGVRYRPSDLLNLGLALRHTDGRNPNFTATGQSNDYERQDLSLTANWRPSGITALSGRLSRTTTDHEFAGGRDFSGLTGGLGVDWRPSGRSRLGLQLSRETSDESIVVTTLGPDPDAPQQLALVETPLVDSRLSNTLRLNGSYALTGKIMLDAGLRWSRRRLEDAVAPGAGGPLLLAGSDRTTAASLGASYAVNRSLQLGCGIARERRTADTANALTAPFRATTASCQAQLTLQ
ncbi:hypothetical protein [Caldimonas tepidiphila]|uniref:hypothetical protein n=1 Tax=Caldimonas tepidiphila TaxID=2315841 RepID=UPI000E5BA25B|nr:hypothetical protein [Caldimonas tepidiphila]